MPEHIDLDARFGEREEGRAEADLDILAQITAGKEPQHGLEVGHGNAAIDQKPFNLVKHE